MSNDKIKTRPIENAVVLILACGYPDRIAIKHCEKAGIAAKEAKAIIAKARRRITLAADYKKDEQVGIAITRLNELFTNSLTAKDMRTALQAQRELNKIMSLYDNYEEEEKHMDDGESHRQLELIATYLLPLKLLSGKYPIEEHARVAAEKIRNHGL